MESNIRLDIFDQANEMLKNVTSSHLAFITEKYNLCFQDVYLPTTMLDESTPEFCRVVLNCYFIILNHYRQDAYIRKNGSGVAKDCYIFKNITRDGSPSIRPNVMFMRGEKATTLVNFVKNNHNEFFVVNMREFLSIACFIFVHLEDVRKKHAELGFLFEECMFYQSTPRIPRSHMTLQWPLRRYFAFDPTAEETEMLPHHFSYHTLMYLAVFVINEVVKGKSPSCLAETTIDLQCGNFVITDLAQVTSALDFEVVAENLAMDNNIPADTYKNYMVEIMKTAMNMRFRYREFANDSVLFVQYGIEMKGGLLRVSIRNLFHWVLFRNLIDATLRHFPFLNIATYTDYFVMDETTLKILHMMSIGLCSSLRTRWFSGIMPIYPLVARIWIDTTTKNCPTQMDMTLAWCATFAWLSILFGKQNDFKKQMKPPAALFEVLQAAISRPLRLEDLFILPSTAEHLRSKKLSYCHSQVRAQELYYANRDHSFIDFLFKVERETCKSCHDGKCVEHRLCGIPPTAFDFSLYIAPNQEEGSPINASPTLQDTIMMLLPNKMTKSTIEKRLNFCSVFANAFYPFLARFEVLPSSWAFNF